MSASSLSPLDVRITDGRLEPRSEQRLGCTLWCTESEFDLRPWGMEHQYARSRLIVEEDGSVIDQVTANAAAVDARLAAAEYDNAHVWLRARPKLTVPLAAEVWVTDTARTHVLLVRHRVRGWVPPGGTVENGEIPRVAAARELREETGVSVDLSKVPAAVAVRSFRADWAPTLSLSYGAVIGRDVPLLGEDGQPVRWVELNDAWESVFPDDRDRILAYVRALR